MLFTFIHFGILQKDKNRLQKMLSYQKFHPAISFQNKIAPPLGITLSYHPIQYSCILYNFPDVLQL